LDKLSDIVIPDQVHLWPPGPAWFVVAALVIIALAFFGWRQVLKWRRNAYRRAAVNEIDLILHLGHGRSQGAAVASEINQVLKRVALVSYDRRLVAGLAGTEWIEFLQSTGGRFADAQGMLLASVYQNPGATGETGETQDQIVSLVSVSRKWIRGHDV
jgi:hypothetical protein